MNKDVKQCEAFNSCLSLSVRFGFSAYSDAGEPGPVPPGQDEGHQRNQGSSQMGKVHHLVVALLRVGISVSIDWTMPYSK